MTWQPIDFQGIVTLDQPLVDQLQRYLEEKESRLGTSILNAIQPKPGESFPPVLEKNTTARLTLSDAIEFFAKRIRLIARQKKRVVSRDDWISATEHINNALWDYSDVLQECVTELFQQLGQVSFDRWHADLSHVLVNIKEMLLHAMEDLIWAIRRLETQLWSYRWICEGSSSQVAFWKKVFLFWKSLLDRSLLSIMKRSEKFLKNQYKVFQNRYEEYRKLNEKIEQSLKKFAKYNILQSLDSSSQRDFKQIYRLLKLWMRNSKSKILPEREPVLALRKAVSTEKAYSIFKEYHQALRNALFERSRIFKTVSAELFKDDSSRKLVQDVIGGYCAELHTLGATVGRYRDFLLRTDPDPYVRTRWGFTEWIVGPEHMETRGLLNLGYEIENLDLLFVNLEESLEKAPTPLEGKKAARLNEEIQHALHEMGQPLMSRHAMRIKAEYLLSLLEQLDELGSFNRRVVDVAGKIFSKALRADWQYHVLHEIPLFHQLYYIHQGIVGPIEDRGHINRYNLFRSLIEQVEGWVKNRDTQRHANEIEHDISDMRKALQDFLAHVQRISKEGKDPKTKKEVASKLAQQLLEYRYLFGAFFSNLPQNESEGKLIRNQFLFVDQYFESIENQLHQLRAAPVEHRDV